MVNMAILVGNLGADPELRTTQNNTAVANCRLATNERRANGEEHTEWHSLVAWGKQAEVLGEYARKGTRLFVQGVIRTRDWENNEGQKRRTTEIHVREFKFLGGRGEDSVTQDSTDTDSEAGTDAEPLPF